MEWQWNTFIVNAAKTSKIFFAMIVKELYEACKSYTENVPVEVKLAKHEEISVLALLTNLLYEKK